MLPLNIRHLDHGIEISFSKLVKPAQIDHITEMAYLEAWNKAVEYRYPEILRIWNFIPEINKFTDGVENYQIFCKGRKTAFTKLHLEKREFPAATAVGSKNALLEFKFLFGTKKPTPITNRLQIEAYNYPPEHGPTPPSFARASVLESTVFLSGTASIRGHETMFCGDLEGQLNCTLENIDEVLKETQRTTKKTISKKSLAWRVYLRDPAFRTKIEEKLKTKLGLSIEYIHADICRSELMLEIEGLGYGL